MPRGMRKSYSSVTKQHIRRMIYNECKLRQICTLTNVYSDRKLFQTLAEEDNNQQNPNLLKKPVTVHETLDDTKGETSVYFDNPSDCVLHTVAVSKGIVESSVECSEIETKLTDTCTETLNSAKHNFFQEELQRWMVEYSITQEAASNLLQLLGKHECFSFLPKNGKSFLKTPKSVSTRVVPPGEYVHFGVKKGIENFIRATQKSHKDFSLQINIDGLPISVSTSAQLWPILSRIIPTSYIFVIGCYYGQAKPHDANDFLYDFVEEVKELTLSGLVYENQIINFSLHSLICDLPAKAFVTRTPGHAGYYSCSKCETSGELLRNRVCFPDTNCRLRTDESFKEQKQQRHHCGTTSLTEISGFGLVSQVPQDYMHSVCIGVTKKLISSWLKGDLNVRIPARNVTRLTEHLLRTRVYIPQEFVRKPQEIQMYHRWKATELRQFLLYTGPTVLRGNIDTDMYVNFLTLHVAVRILCSTNLLKYMDYAESLLEHFVKSFAILYGSELISQNVHGLCHLVTDVRKFGVLDSFSAFCFENYLKNLKRLLRKSEKPLQQLHNRYKEIETFAAVRHENTRTISVEPSIGHKKEPVPADFKRSQFSKLTFENFVLKTKDSDNCCKLKNGSIVCIENIAYDRTNELCIIGRKFEDVRSLYKKPCDSALLECYFAKSLSVTQHWTAKSIVTTQVAVTRHIHVA